MSHKKVANEDLIEYNSYPNFFCASAKYKYMTCKNRMVNRSCCIDCNQTFKKQLHNNNQDGKLKKMDSSVK